MANQALKEKIEKAMKEHIICSSDEAIAAIEFVRDLIEIDADHTEENEPYATNYIREMREAANRVSNLEDMIRDNIED